VDSAGKVTVVGAYSSSLVVGPGSTALQAASTSLEPFVVTLDGASGETLCTNRYGDPSSAGASALSIAINRAGAGANKDRAALGGFFTRVIDFGGQTTALSTGTATASTSSAFLLEM